MRLSNLVPFNLKIAASAVVVFLLFATVSAAFAESKTFGGSANGVSCYAGGNTGSNSPNYTEWWSNTYPSSGSCQMYYVRLRDWTTVPSIRLETSILTASGASTSYAKLPMRSGDNFVAAHKAKLNNSVYFQAFTSHDGSHSTQAWYCSGSSGGATNCTVP
jgi:hypothetical protein